MNRTFKISLILGNRGTGKTNTLFREVIPEYLAVCYKTTRTPGVFKIAVCDLENNYNYNSLECLKDPAFADSKKKLLTKYIKTPVKIIRKEKFALIKQGMFRVMPGNDEHGGEFAKSILSDIVYNRAINNCLVVVEDSARFMPDNNGLDSQLRDLIINSKQRSMDIVLMFHAWTDIPPKLLRWIDQIYLHKCDESVISRKKNISEVKLELILRAEEKLKWIKNKYASEKIILN